MAFIAKGGVVAITGGARGIGFAVAKALAKAGRKKKPLLHRFFSFHHSSPCLHYLPLASLLFLISLTIT
jgi:hypothetical protein